MTESISRRDAAAFLHQAGSTPVAHAFASCRGAWAVDETGHRFLDLHGNTCHNIGYAHPRMVAALKQQLDTLTFTPRLFTSEPAVELAEMLAARWPYGNARVLLGVSGTDAIEMALKLAYVATGRTKTIAFDGSWHGAALGALSVGGTAAEREEFPALEGCHHVHAFWPRNIGETAEAAAQTAFEALEYYLAARDIAAILSEPIRATPHLPPDWFWPEVRELCDRTGTLLIFDEIPTGLGKTGRFFASEHFEAVPDITVLGKSLGGGILPLSAVIANAELDVAQHLGIGHYTHQKNPMLARAGIETLRIIDDEKLVERSASMGRWALGELKSLSNKLPVYAGARGIGCAMAVECADHDNLSALKNGCYRLGLNTGTADGRYLTLSPPLNISQEDFRFAIGILAEAGSGFI
ncbi:MAG: aminotransferase class III-fold pyridoxal phosphate-dependent enzyme [Nisaea sp.]|uniref:aminotransferase class III-fold pyridoxal phosphate-dependent enzyme n=1 Tax=Nisaea sp. TaxID=2024842 RepID=UPI001B221366|nr:aminotransferase class III-fold pyridoxal phosphate-dependent enzyme [Nisaea sp.]MBO6560310.1 aminotransferase class III-fold pyridoxal phosphate-dependent enzyme [Nisaea sp.]